MHFPNRNFDLNTLFCMIVMENQMKCLHKLSPKEVRSEVLEAPMCSTVKIMASLPFVTIIV
jgi:hypothetical protein